MWTRTYKPGDGIRVEHHGTHPAVVLQVRDEDLVVICGTSKPRPHMEEVCISPNSAAGTMLELSMPTYFNQSKIAVIADKSRILRKLPKRCPANVYNQLMAFLDRLAAETQ